MKGLILKDLSIIKNQMKSLLIIMVLFVFLSIVNKEFSFILFIVPFYMIMILITTLSYDEFNHWDTYCNTLPFSRKDIVKAKYLLFNLCNIFLLVIGLLVSVIVPLFTDITFESLFSSIIGTVLGISIVISLLIPFYYKYGSQKGRIMLFVVIMASALLIGGLFKILQGINFDVLAVINKLENINFIILIFGILLFVLIIIYISYLISCRIYSKKEF